MEKQVQTVLLEGSLTLRHRELADGRRSLYLDWVAGRVRRRTALSLYLLPETTVKAQRTNAATWRKARRLLQTRCRQLLAEQLAREAAEATRATLLSEWLRSYGELQQRRGIRSLGGLHSLRQRLLEYDPDRTLERTDKAFIAGFIDYLRSGYRRSNGQPLAALTRCTMIGQLNAALNQAVSEGRIALNPYRLFETSERMRAGQEHKREYLTIDELKRVIGTPCRSPLAKQLCLFSCFTGLRLSDAKALRWSDVTQCGERWQLGIRMRKTDRCLYLPLSEQARRWMPPRGGKAAAERIFAAPPHNLNRLIGQWVQAAGIPKHITHHCGRHTYATMLLTLGVDIYTVSQLLGHASLRHTQRYAQIVDKQKDDAVHLADPVFE